MCHLPEDDVLLIFYINFSLYLYKVLIDKEDENKLLVSEIDPLGKTHSILGGKWDIILW